jgi:hypothetical protein
MPALGRDHRAHPQRHRPRHWHDHRAFAYIERSTGALELGPPKSRASRRRVDLPGPIVELLRAHLEHYVDADERALVFTGPTGRPLRRSNFNKLVGWQ